MPQKPKFEKSKSGLHIVLTAEILKHTLSTHSTSIHEMYTFQKYNCNFKSKNGIYTFEIKILLQKILEMVINLEFYPSLNYRHEINDTKIQKY